MFGFAVLTAVMTAPGQTIGVSVFIDHFIDDLSLSRSTVALCYGIGTVAGSWSLPLIGRRIDQHGARASMTVIAVLFSIAIAAMAGVQGVVTLTLGFIGIRLLGQGALSLVSTVAVAHWFDQLRGLVIGTKMTVVSMLMTLAPFGLNALIGGIGWRTTWLVAALIVAVVVTPVAWFGIIDRPEDVGQIPDGRPFITTARMQQDTRRGASRSEALRTRSFWVLTSGVASTSMLYTAVSFHQISLLEEAGLTSSEAAAMFLPQIIGSAIAGVTFGLLSDRLPGRVIIPASMTLLATSLFLASIAETMAVVVVYAIMLGMAGGANASLSGTLLPRWYGTDHLGSIQGVLTTASVVGSAIGPVVLAVMEQSLDSFQDANRILLFLPVLVGLQAMTLRSQLGRVA